MDEVRPLLGTRAFIERFRDVTALRPDQIAVTDLERSATYAELAHAIRVTALDILSSGYPTGPALVTVDGTHEFIIGMLAAAASGRSCIVTGTQLSTSALQDFAQQTGAGLLIGLDRPERARSGLPIVVPASTPTVDASLLGLDDLLVEPRAHRVDWSEVTALTATSGSTGAPKVIEHLEAATWGREIAALDALREKTHFGTNLSVSAAFRNRAAVALISGATFTGFPLDRYAPSELLRRLASCGLTNLSVTPSLLRRLHAAARGQDALRGVPEVSSVGEPLRWSDVRLARELCGSEVVVINRFGSTEAGRISERHVLPSEPLQEGPLSVGSARPGRHVWIAGQDGRPVAAGVTGRIVIEGVFTTRGAALEDLGGGVSRFWSSDIGHIDQQDQLWFEGRADHMVKVAGTRVEPGAVEDVLRSLPGVVDVAVLPTAIAPDEWRLVAHVVFEGEVPDVEEIRRATAERVVAIAVPVRFFLRREPLPLLASGKIDGRQLMATAASETDATGVT